MTKFLLTDWEINGYDDSDFMCSYFDNVKGSIGFFCYGSTRFPSATNIGFSGETSSVIIEGDHLMLPTTDVVEQARLVLEENIFQRLQAADKRLTDSPEPEDLSVGLKVTLRATARMQIRESSPCQKCGGSGKWTNPRNASDLRNCFTCNGMGRFVGAKVKTEQGKQAFRTLVIGLTGEVVEWTSFGQFYANGYNKPNRDNTTVQFRLDDGDIVRASLNKLGLARGYKPESELRDKARSLSFNYGFSALYPRFAWDTCNYAAKVAAPIHR